MKDPKNPISESSAGEAQHAPGEGGAGADGASGGEPTPMQFHQTQLALFTQSLAAEGEKAYERWGLSMLYSMEPEQIQAQFEALGVKPKDALDHYNQGCLLAVREKYGEAATAFERALKLDPQLAEADYNYALALEHAGQKPAARKAWAAYLEKFAEHADVVDVKQHLTALVDE